MFIYGVTLEKRRLHRLAYPSKGGDELNTIKIDQWHYAAKNLRSFIRKRVEDSYDAEDVLQDVLFKVHRNLSQLENMANLAPWIYQIARNSIIDYYRSRKVTLPVSELPEFLTNEESSENVNSEIITCLKPMLDQLPEKYRQALILAYIEGFTQKEVAERLGLSISGAKSRVQRGRQKLKEMLLDCCSLEFDRVGNIIEYEHKHQNCTFCSNKPRK